MTHPLRIVPLLASALMLLSCTSEDQELLRRSIDKADLVGSCSGFCGGASDGNCWCDDLCTRIGDCCSDVNQVCSIGVDGGPAAEFDCTNGVDDDANGLIDCADPSCQFPMGPCGTADAGVLTESSCTNGIDDDFDGQIDCADGDCTGSPSCGAVDGGVLPMDAGPAPLPDAAITP